MVVEVSIVCFVVLVQGVRILRTACARCAPNAERSKRYAKFCV